MPHHCKTIGCHNPAPTGRDFCGPCLTEHQASDEALIPSGEASELDIYAVHHHFAIQDPSGCIHEASKKLLTSGSDGNPVVTYRLVREAHALLTRWLQLNGS